MSARTAQLDAWRAVVTSHAAVTERVQKALAAADLPPLSWFELLAAVEDSPDGQPRMSELAEYLTLSRGGITKLVDRLQAAGYIERVACSDDRRSLQASLTEEGRELLGEMRGVYAEEIARYLGSVSEREAALVADVLSRIAANTCDAERAEAAQPAPAS